ncbi:MAG: oligosaccharide flippase family protein [Bacteroidota bacterium]|nr:oligosaccharide flippase family protein [Bacteroidota bacterium]
MSFSLTEIKNIFSLKNNSRSSKALKNIIVLFFFQGFNFVFNLAIVPLTLGYLGKTEYGIWLTLSSIIGWLSFLDLGIGNGLRNKLAEALAKDDYSKARIFVSTAYAIFTIAAVALWIIFAAIYRFIKWEMILQSPVSLNEQIYFLVLFVFIFFSIQIVLKLIYSITAADQKPGINGVLTFFANLLTLGYIFILKYSTKGSLFLLGTGSGLIPALVYLLGSIFLFNRSFKNFAPGFKFIQFKYAKELFSLGIQFFVIQVTGLIVFATNNLIITQLYGPNEVTTYNIAYKLFFLVTMVFSIILNPFWTAYTEAYVKSDFAWIRKTTRYLFYLWIGFTFITGLLLVFSNYIYRIWVGGSIQIPFALSLIMGVFITISNWNNIFVYFINGTGKIKIQFYYAIVQGIINIPLSITMGKILNIGPAGVMVGTCITMLIGSLFNPIQYFKIISKTDNGIWGK